MEWMQEYYFMQLDKPRQAVYQAMRMGLTQLSAVFPVPRMEVGVLSEVLFQLRLDHPEIFYVAGCSFRVHPQASHVEVVPEYLFPKGKIREHQGAMQARLEKLCRPVQGKSALEQEQYIHDFICTSVRYDKLKKPYSHEIIGPLGHGVGVCEGMAKAVKALCDRLGLWCVVAIAQAAPERGVRYRHAWNVVQLNGSYYHLDATFDRTLTGEGEVRYDYFNLDDRQLFRDHEALLYPVPACTDGTQGYYRTHRCSLTRLEEVEKRAVQAARKGKPLLFQWRGGPLTREVQTQLLTLLGQAAAQKGRHIRAAINRPQAVFQVEFPQQPPQTACTDQRADAEAE